MSAENSGCDPVSIDAVAAAIERFVAKDARRNLVLSECTMLAAEIAAGGFLRTLEDRAVLEAVAEWEETERTDRTVSRLFTETALRRVRTAQRARRAAGGTEAQP